MKVSWLRLSTVTLSLLGIRRKSDGRCRSHLGGDESGYQGPLPIAPRFNRESSCNQAIREHRSTSYRVSFYQVSFEAVTSGDEAPMTFRAIDSKRGSSMIPWGFLSFRSLYGSLVTFSNGHIQKWKKSLKMMGNSQIVGINGVGLVSDGLFRLMVMTLNLGDPHLGYCWLYHPHDQNYEAR